MEIEFDPKKRLRTLAERGIDFADARFVLEDALYTTVDARAQYGEVRLRTAGLLKGRHVFVVWTPRVHGAAVAVRVISMRKANDREIAALQERLRQDGRDPG